MCKSFFMAAAAMVVWTSSFGGAAAEPRNVIPPPPTEPFGLTKTVSPSGGGHSFPEFDKIIANMKAAKQELDDCRNDPDVCSATDQWYNSVVDGAAARKGHSRFEYVNERINAQIQYTPDAKQWGKIDVWTLPVDGRGGGSLDKRIGDCEDFVLAKFGALNLAGELDINLRMVLVYDNIARADHAILAVYNDNAWWILDNRWNKVVEDKELRQFKPLFVVEKSGVQMLTKIFRIGDLINVTPNPAVAQLKRRDN
jgi:predicted transglutaminase-like cysteine proteinase